MLLDYQKNIPINKIFSRFGDLNILYVEVSHTISRGGSAFGSLLAGYSPWYTHGTLENK
jgi:hypothetical protein